MDAVQPNHDDPTIAMKRVEAPPRTEAQVPPPIVVPPPARPGTYQSGPVEEAVVVGPAPPLKPVGPRFPVGNPFAYTLARVAAFAIDLGLVAGVLTILAYSLIAINPINGLPTNSEGGFDATFAISVVLALVYIVTFEALFGTTLGKLAFGLHVYALRDRRVGFARAFVRTLFIPLDALGIGAVLSLLPGHRRIGDLAGGTVVAAQSPLRGFAPVLGWIAILILAGLPFVLTSFNRVVAGFFAFVQFAPPLVGRFIALVQSLLGALPHG